jgi:hypothetical protein
VTIQVAKMRKYELKPDEEFIFAHLGGRGISRE